MPTPITASQDNSPAESGSSVPDAAADFSFQALVECSSDIITVVASDGRIVYDSPAVQGVLGYRQGELVGRNAFELVHADDIPAAFTLLVETVGRLDVTSSLTFRFQHRDGSWKWLASTGRVLSSGPGQRLVITSREASGAPAESAGSAAPEPPGTLEAAHLEMLQRLALAAEFRDDDTGQHIRRVGELSATLAGAMGLERSEAELIRCAAPLHDVGKIGIRDAILLKRGPLSAEELEVMRTHTVLGARLLSRGGSALVRSAECIAMHHHERWDGAGYPAGFSGHEIPLSARIVGIVDFYDALTHDRPYRSAWPQNDVLREIEGESGTRFDPYVAEAFLDLVKSDTLPRSAGAPEGP
ncbi:MAG: HD domain-containing protein [Gemmatimonadetes bacterium]|nr:HD domain-containing protein [Gemmatimonadota bacterium]